MATITDGGLGDLAVVSVFFVGGLVLVYLGFDSYRTSRLIRNTPTERVRSIAVGRTEVNGHARRAGRTFPQPFAAGECLYRDWSVEEYRERRVRDDDGGVRTEEEWVTVDSGRDVAPFFVEDDTGRVLVDAPAGATFELSSANSTTITVGAGRSLPPAVAAFYDRPRGTERPTEPSADRDDPEGGLLDDVADTVAGVVDAVGGRGPTRPSSSRKRRFSQEVLPVDEEVYVFGGASPREGGGGSNEERLVIRRDDGTGRFIVSDRDEGSLTAHYSRRAPIMMLAGLVASAAALYVLLVDYVGL